MRAKRKVISSTSVTNLFQARRTQTTLYQPWETLCLVVPRRPDRSQFFIGLSTIRTERFFSMRTVKTVLMRQQTSQLSIVTLSLSTSSDRHSQRMLKRCIRCNHHLLRTLQLLPRLSSDRVCKRLRTVHCSLSQLVIIPPSSLRCHCHQRCKSCNSRTTSRRYSAEVLH